MEILVTNVNQAVEEGFHYLAEAGVKETSRNGLVIVAPEPVMTVYTRPLERVLFSPLRDANPFFHLMESLWMLAGRADVAFPAYFAKNITQYSDDGKTFWGAYGRRWRSWFGYDQLAAIVCELRHSPDSRRAVLQMWDANAFDVDNDETRDSDLRRAQDGGKDVPCNTSAFFDLRGGKLNLTVLCRSNDALWGAYGANAVHFSILQEYMAAAVGALVGVYRQFSNNFHVYPVALGPGNPRVNLHALATDAGIENHYKRNILPFPLVNTNIEIWDKDLQEFFTQIDKPEEGQYRDKFFSMIAMPMHRAWKSRKEKRNDGLNWIDYMLPSDWKLACFEWIERREMKKAAR